jgi:phosphinothricin acetyltransferase
MKPNNERAEAGTDLVREARPQDAARLREIYAYFVRKTPISFELAPPTRADFARRMRTAHVWLVYEREGRIAGYAYAGKHRDRAAYRWSIDVSVYLDPAYHRQGIGRRLYASLLECARALGYCTAYAGITLPNPGSQVLHESFGFRPVGVYRHVGYKQGKWYDVGWWSLDLRKRPARPPEPRTAGALRSRPAWRQAVAAGLRSAAGRDGRSRSRRTDHGSIHR